MADPVLHVLAGPNGAGKSTLYETVVGPVTRLGQRRSFVTETVFSHVSKLELLEDAMATGYLVTMHVVMVPEELAVARVMSRVAAGGHVVHEQKVRERYQRLWPLIAQAIKVVDHAVVYDNTRVKPAFRVIATFEHGSVVSAADWPRWTPKLLREAAT